MSIRLHINGREYAVHSPAGTPLLWVLRDELGLTGTKFGCGAGLCGACTVHVAGQAVRACTAPVEVVAGQHVTTIEGLGDHPLKAAWLEERTPQCGYCQSGMLMAAAALVAETPQPSPEQVDATITNLCRCGTYPRVRRAIARATKQS